MVAYLVPLRIQVLTERPGDSGLWCLLNVVVAAHGSLNED